MVHLEIKEMKCDDLLTEIWDTATAIAERARNIPIGPDPPYSLVVALADAVDRLRRVEVDLDNLTEDDYRDG